MEELNENHNGYPGVISWQDYREALGVLEDMHGWKSAWDWKDERYAAVLTGYIKGWRRINGTGTTMNKTKIETADYTWNPVTGCKRGCFYCYARAIAGRFNRTRGFKPTFHHDRMFGPEKVKKPSIIFVCSMADLFGDWIPDSWILDILKVAQETPRHTFQFLTKSPRRLKHFNPWPANCWVGATVTRKPEYKAAMRQLEKVEARVRFLSIEPLLGQITLKATPDWVIIGAMTGKGSKVYQPQKQWIEKVIRSAQEGGAAVFCKSSININTVSLPREWPMMGRDSIMKARDIG